MRHIPPFVYRNSFLLLQDTDGRSASYKSHSSNGVCNSQTFASKIHAQRQEVCQNSSDGDRSLSCVVVAPPRVHVHRNHQLVYIQCLAAHVPHPACSVQQRHQSLDLRFQECRIQSCLQANLQRLRQDQPVLQRGSPDFTGVGCHWQPSPQHGRQSHGFHYHGAHSGHHE